MLSKLLINEKQSLKKTIKILLEILTKLSQSRIPLIYITDLKRDFYKN